MFAIKKNISAGIECHFSQNGEQSFNAVVIREKKGILEITSELEFKTLNEDILKSLPSSNPFNICITGKGIIVKKVELSDESKWNEVLNKCLPNTQVSDFYIQKYKISEREWIVSVIRRSVVDEILSQFKGRIVTGLFIGPFQSNLFKFLANGDLTLNIRNYSIKISDGIIRETNVSSGFQNQSEKIVIGETPIKVNSFFSYLAATQFLIGGETQSNAHQVEQNKSEYSARKKFQNYLYIAASVFLFAIIINVLFSYQVQNSIDQLKLQLSNNSMLADSISKLSEQLENKKIVIFKSGLLENTRYSYYVDELSYDLPVNITFSEIRVNPIKKMDEGNEYDIDHGRIVIKGIAEGGALSAWTNDLKTKKWIKHLQIVNYGKNADSGEGEFQLLISI